MTFRLQQISSTLGLKLVARLHLEISNVHRQYKRLLTQAGIGESKLHDTHHTAITRISEAGTQIEVTTELGRYADARTPQRYYIHITEEPKRKAMNDYLRNLQTNLVLPHAK
jgi:integrase